MSNIQLIIEERVADIGKFVYILDCEGNKTELWEPIDDEYEKIVEGRTK